MRVFKPIRVVTHVQIMRAIQNLKYIVLVAFFFLEKLQQRGFFSYTNSLRIKSSIIDCEIILARSFSEDAPGIMRRDMRL